MESTNPPSSLGASSYQAPRLKLASRLLTNDAEIEPHELDYKTEWKSAALDEELLKALERIDLHQCLQEKVVDLLLLVQKEPGNDPPGAMFHAMAFPIGENKYQCGKKGCPQTGTAEHMRQHLHRKDHLGIPFFLCQHCPSKFYRKADLTRHEKNCVPLQESMAAAHPTVGYNLDNVVANRVKKNAKYGPLPAPYAPDLRRKHGGVQARMAPIPPPFDLSSGLPPYPQQNSDFIGINQQGQPLIPVPAPWQSHAAGVDCPPTDVYDLSQPLLAEQPNFSPLGSNYPYPSPFDYLNAMIAQTFPAPGPNDGGLWQHGLPQPAPPAADTTGVGEKRDASEAELGSKVRPRSPPGYWEVCSKKSGFPSGTICLVMLTALIVVLVLLGLGVSFAYHLWSLDTQSWQPVLLGLLD